MEATGQNQRQLTMDLWYLQDLVWSPDGGIIAYDYGFDAQSWQRLGRVSMNIGFPGSVYNPNADLVDAWMGDWSPDGAWLYFTRVEYVVQGNKLYINNSWIERVPGAGGEPQRLAGNTGFDMEPNLEKRDLVPPMSQVQPLPAFAQWSGAPLAVTVTASDTGGSGLATDQLTSPRLHRSVSQRTRGRMDGLVFECAGTGTRCATRRHRFLSLAGQRLGRQCRARAHSAR